jgi:hypothetical protein
MQRLLIAVLFSLTMAAGLVAAPKCHCFREDGLKVQQTISYTLTGNKLEGTFDVSGYDPKEFRLKRAVPDRLRIRKVACRNLSVMPNLIVAVELNKRVYGKTESP